MLFCSSANRGEHVAVLRHVGAQRLGELPLGLGERVGADHEIGHDAAAAAHDPAGAGPVDRTRPDRRVAGRRVGLTEQRVARLERGLRQLLLFALGRALDGAAARREPARGGELERHAFAQREERLHQPLAEGRRADHHRAVVVLERAGDDLRGAGGAFVHQHDDRQLGPGLARVVEELLGRAPRPAAGGDDLLLGDRGRGRRPRRPGRAGRRDCSRRSRISDFIPFRFIAVISWRSSPAEVSLTGLREM